MIFYFLLCACQQKDSSGNPIVDLDEDGFFSDVDCDDGDVDVHPEAQEICNELDDDCDSLIDDADDSIDLGLGIDVFVDADGDGFGDLEARLCVISDGFSMETGDCDDERADVFPQNQEICNDVDDNCDGVIDTDAIDKSLWFEDTDGDGFGNAEIEMYSCLLPEGFVADAQDCDDGDAAIYPQAPEICNDIDDDCDGIVDDQDEDIDWTTGIWFYEDVDGDGFGRAEVQLQRCTLPSGYAYTDDDCNDDDVLIHPEAIEVCDQIDNDCDETTLEDGLVSVSIQGGVLSNLLSLDNYAISDAQAIYFCSGSFDISLESSEDVELYGLGDVSLYAQEDYVLEQSGGTVYMDGFSVFGGIHLLQTTATLENLSITEALKSGLYGEESVIEGNALYISASQGLQGGGVFLSQSSASLNSSIVEDNQAQEGGAIYAEESTVSLVDTLVQENSAVLGGGVYMQSSSLSCTGLVNDIDGIRNNDQWGLMMDESSNFMTTHCDVLENEPYDIQTGGSTYSATEDGNYNCSFGMCGSSVAHTVSGVLVDNYSNNHAFRGNIYDVVGNSTLDSFDVGLDFTYCDIVLSVFSRMDSSQEWMLLYEDMQVGYGNGGWVSSDVVGLPLLDGEQILLGAGWNCDSAPDYSSYTSSLSGYGVGDWSGFRVVDTNFMGTLQPEDFLELSSTYLYEQRLYVTSLY